MWYARYAYTVRTLLLCVSGDAVSPQEGGRDSRKKNLGTLGTAAEGALRVKKKKQEEEEKAVSGSSGSCNARVGFQVQAN